MLMEDIKARLEDKTNYPYEEGFNPYQLWMDAKALLNEMQYWKDRALEAEKQAEWNNLSIADREALIKDACKL